MELLLVLGAIAVVAVAALAAASQHRREVRAQYDVLAAFAVLELGGLLREPPGLIRRLSGAHVTGRDPESRRRVSLEVGQVRAGAVELRIGVEVDPRFALVIQLPTLVARLRRVFGAGPYVRTGQDEVDERFLVMSESPTGAKQVFVHGGAPLVGALSELLEERRTEEVVARDGWLYLDCVLQDLDPQYFRWFLRRLHEIARAYERHEIVIRRRDAAPRRSYGWTGGAEGARCPYCRESITGEEEDLVVCASCDTLHHEECFQTHGGCTIFGCGGHERERVGERA